MHKIIETIKCNLRNLLPDSDGPLLVALSGGSDSIGLARILIDIHEDLNREICAFHLDHGIRGASSASDADFVKNWCRNKSIHLFSERAADLELFRREQKLSLEEAAREYRYERIIGKAKQINAAAVLTGHTLDDDVETFIMRILTGASLKALSGIPGVTIRNDVPIIRPMLDCRSKDIRDYLVSLDEKWCEDETNYQPDTLRNLIRLKALPYLEELFGRDIKGSVARTLSNLKREYDLLDSLILTELDEKKIWHKFTSPWKTGYVADSGKLKSAHEAIRYRILLWALNELGLPLKRRKSDIFKMADEFIRLNGGKRSHHIGNGIFLARSGKAMIVAKKMDDREPSYFDPMPIDTGSYIREFRKMLSNRIEESIDAPGTYMLGDFEFTVESVDATEMMLDKSELMDASIEYFDPSILDGGIELVFGSTITNLQEQESKDSFEESYTKLGKCTLIDNWVSWPVLKKKDDVIWIIGVSRRNLFGASGTQAIKISAKIPGNFMVFI